MAYVHVLHAYNIVYNYTRTNNNKTKMYVVDGPYTYMHCSTCSLTMHLQSSFVLFFSPSLQGPAVTHLEAKRIVLKMLAVASNHHKMQKQLSNERAVGLVADCLHDPSLENVTNSVITLANVAQHTGSHKLVSVILCKAFRLLSIVNKL